MGSAYTHCSVFTLLARQSNNHTAGVTLASSSRSLLVRAHMAVTRKSTPAVVGLTSTMTAAHGYSTDALERNYEVIHQCRCICVMYYS